MNPYKKETGWILCPSKSFPGKFYYFNVANGETAWSLNEVEAQTLRSPQIQKIDNTHSYPEPNSPPVGQSPILSKQITIPNVYSRDYSSINKSISNNVSTILIQPMHYGANYSNRDTPSYQIQVPMMMGPEFYNNAHQVVMIVMNQRASRQVDPLPAIQRSSSEPDRDLFIQNGTTPLSQRFVNYENPVKKFQNNVADNFSAKKLFTSTPNKTVTRVHQHNQPTINNSRPQNNINNDTPITKTIKRPSINNLTRHQTPDKTSLHNSSMFTPNNSHTNFNTKNCSLNNSNSYKMEQKHWRTDSIKESTSNQVNFIKPANFDANPFRTDIENSTLKESINVDIPQTLVNSPDLEVSPPWSTKDLSLGNSMEKSPLSKDHNVDKADMGNLGKNDLRRIILAKKRKSVDVETPDSSEGNKIKTTKQEEPPATTKKKVTFNLTPESISDVASHDTCTFNTPDDYLPNEENTAHSAIEELRQLAPATARHDEWYLVVDTIVLVEDFEFFSNFVQLDRRCRLLLPARVLSDAAALSRGAGGGRRRVTLARRTLRLLATPQTHIVVQPAHIHDSSANWSADYAILHCCLDAIEHHIHVVLITNNEDLQIKAKCLKIHCFDSQQIKDTPNKKPELHFDIKKIKISVPNVPEKGSFENIAQDYEMTSFDEIGNTSNYMSRDEMPNSNCKELTRLKIAGKSEWRHSNSDIMPNSNKETNESFQIQKHAANFIQAKKIQTTSAKEPFNSVTNSNEAVSFYFQNRNSKNNPLPEIKKKIDSEKESQTVSFFFQNNVKDKEVQRSMFKSTNCYIDREKLKRKENAQSIFEIDNDLFHEQIQPKRSVFEIEEIEKINSNTAQATMPVIDYDFKPKVQRTVLNYESYKNKALQSKKLAFESDQLATKPSTMTASFENKNKGAPPVPSIFEIEKCHNKDAYNPSIFEKENSDKPMLPEEINNPNLNEYVKIFCSKHKIAENVIEERKEELLCNFKQVMEECLSNVLKQWSYELKSSPPWTLYEALQCVLKLYGGHTPVGASVTALLRLHACEDIGAGHIVKMMCCGLMLVEYMKKICKASDAQVLTDAEDAIHTMVRNLDVDVSVQRDQPANYHSDTATEEQNHRQNFVKRRSDVIKYLKKHYSAWTNYDDTLDERKTTWGKNLDINVVRTLGKNLNMLKITNSNTMTMNRPEAYKVTDKNNTTNPEQNDKKESQDNIMHKRGIVQGDNKNKSEMKPTVEQDKVNYSTIEQDKVNYKNDITRKITKDNSSKNLNKNVTMTITRKIDNSKTTVNFNSQKTCEVKSDVKQTIPKVKGLFDNINQTKERVNDKTADDSKKLLDLNYVTHSHSFGTEDTGQKVVRNIQMIKAFEEKLKRAPLDLDELDYTAITEEEHNDATGNDCVPINIADRENDTKVPPNDHLKVNNKLLNCDSSNNENNTNNGSYSMSLDNCVSNNDVYATNDDVSYKKDARNDYSSMNDNNITSDYVSCLTNVASYGSNDHYAPDTYCGGTRYIDLETNKNLDAANDKYTKVANRDDVTNDSGFENESVQAYSLVKTFLYELNSSFQSVHNFIDESIKEFREGTLVDVRRKMLRCTADAALDQIIQIIDKLKSIIKRESSNGTKLQVLLAGAGSLPSNDKKISNYRLEVTKRLEHAQMLAKVLRVLRSITSDNSNYI